MRCHYEVLNVQEDADDASIKMAYKKLALRWHPDKNLDDEENAKEQFQLVQQAYEVLSDRQERAWYDRHREQILRGANSEYADKNLDVFQYFTTSCFKGYGDDEDGFYTVYRNIFEQIAKEDLDYYENKEEFCEIPSFGTSTSDYDSVVHLFYSYWMSYSTKKSFVWLDPYDIKEIRNRRLLKAVEKENKKIRIKAKKERNEEIRNLVAFVRKRDKRVQAWNKLNEVKIEMNRKKQEEIQKQKLRERKELNESAIQAEWTKFENMTSELQEIEKNLTQEFGNSDLSDTEERSDLYCAACNKLFKTEKSFQNHESSKKHKENVEILREKLLEDDLMFKNVGSEMEVDDNATDSRTSEELIEESSSDRRLVSPNGIETGSSEEEMNVHIPRRKKAKKSRTLVQFDQISPDSDSEISSQPTVIRKRNKIKKNRNLPIIQSSDDDEQKVSTLPVSTSSEDEFFNSKKGRKKTKKSRTKKLQSIDIKSKQEESIEEKAEHIEVSKTDLADSEKNKVVVHICSTCKKDFPSKNKLFQHLKKENHSVFVPSTSNSISKDRVNKKK